MSLLFLIMPLILVGQSLSPDTLTAYKGVATAVTYKGHKAIRLVEEPGQTNGAMAVLKNSEFHDGTIEVDVTGALAPTADATARGFVGIAFRVAPDGSKFECLYIRPTNARADDQLRRNRSVQYISHPDYPWQRLRQETPAQYETYADLVPGEWTKLRIEVKGDKARLWVNGASQPTLLVNDLKHGDSHGALALWIGPGTEAHFANLKISK